jgi:hypothetical protein
MRLRACLRFLGPTAFALTIAVALPATSQASSTMLSMFEDQPLLIANPQAELAQMRSVGATSIRFLAVWQEIAPKSNSSKPPRHFNGANPAAYPAANWAPFDNVVIAAHQQGIQVNLDLQGGAPLWANGPGMPRGRHQNWEPSPRLYGQFVRAVATRYSGSYIPKGSSTPLPRVSFWSIWNEPDYGPSLAPQGLPGNLTIEYSPLQYRRLLDAAWSALMATGHSHDTIVFGEFAPRGTTKWGVFSGMKPLHFLRNLYCLDSRYRPLRGAAARLRGCPTTAAASRQFPAQHPALFKASGVSDHPYMRWYPPNHEQQPDPDYSTLGEIGGFERGLDRIQLAYGSHKRFPIYNTEYGYITSPPKHDNQLEPGNQRYPWVSQTKAAYYLNWAEYLSWHDPRMMSFNQYLLTDALPATRATDWGGFASGLISYNGKPKPTYAAWRMPLYLPVTSASNGSKLHVWGCARPAPLAALDTGQPQQVDIQFQPGSGGPFTTVQPVTVTSTSGCYFDASVVFPGSGTVRLMWTYPSTDPTLVPLGPAVAMSRDVQITLH